MKKGIKICILIVSIIFASVLMPFSVHADSFGIDNILYGNVIQDNYDFEYLDGTQVSYNMYTIRFYLDDLYSGEFDFSFNYYRVNSSTKYSSVTYHVSVSGDYFDLYINNTQYFIDTAKVISAKSVTNANVVLARDWEFPIESYPWINYLLNNGYVKDNTLKVYHYTFPIFHISNTSTPLIREYIGPSTDNDKWVIMAYSDNINNDQQVRDHFEWFSSANNQNTSLDQYFTYSDFEVLFRNFNAATGYDQFRIVRFKYHFSGNPNTNAFLYCKDTTGYFLPIYFNYVNKKNISTDFALNFGLTNDVLDFYRNQGAEESVNNNDDVTEEYKDVTSDVMELEETFTNDFEQNIEVIRPADSSPFVLFGNTFRSSALWVRHQFNSLTTSTPFGSLITFSLTLGLALLLIGRILS